MKIKQAYDAEIFVGAFELEDPEACLPYKAEYDRQFRVYDRDFRVVDQP